MTKIISLVLTSNFLSTFFGLFVTIIIGNSLVIEDFGRFYLITTTFYILSFLIEGGLSTSIPVFLAKYNNYNFYDVLQRVLRLTRNYLQYILLFVIIAVAILFLNGEGDILSYLYVTIGSIIGAISKILNSVLQGKHYWKKFALVNLSLNGSKIAGIAGISLFMTINNLDLILVVFLVSLIIQFTTIILYLNGLKNFKEENTQINTTDYEFLENHYKSYFVITIITVVASRMDIIISNFISNQNSVGTYSMASNLAFIFPLIIGSLIQVLITQKKGILEILSFRLLFKLFFTIICIISLNVLLSPYLIEIVFKGKYDQSINSFLILSTIYIISIAFSPLESQLIKEAPQKILNLKIIQLFILFLLPLVFKSWGVHAILISVLFSRFYSWQFLIRNNYDQIREKLSIKTKI